MHVRMRRAVDCVVASDAAKLDETMRYTMRGSVLPAAFLLIAATLPASAQQPASPEPPTSQQQSVPALQPVQPQPQSPLGGLPPILPQMGILPPSTAHPALPATAPAQLAVPQAAPAVVPATLPHDLSPWGMFMAADIVVKAVMVGLAFASVVTWTIWLAKALELAAAKMRAGRALRRLEAADDLPSAAGRIAGKNGKLSGPVGRLVDSAIAEARRSTDLSDDGVKERAAIALSRIEARAGRAMARGTGLLATIGSTAPFVGLFGTVWGIMNSFIGISQTKTTNLAVVAPGIAEALLATAIGLVAAIPAVIIYNVFSRAISGYRATLSDASGEILRHLSRDLERRRLRPAAGRAPMHAAAE